MEGIVVNRYLIIGAAVVVLVVAAYFVMTAFDATPPQPSPSATSPATK
jgi:hypothetical protein